MDDHLGSDTVKPNMASSSGPRGEWNLEASIGDTEGKTEWTSRLCVGSYQRIRYQVRAVYADGSTGQWSRRGSSARASRRRRGDRRGAAAGGGMPPGRATCCSGRGHALGRRALLRTRRWGWI